MKENNMEMSTLDKLIPRYYKGYDTDILINKLFNKETLTKEEDNALGEAISIYHKKYFDESKKKRDEYRKKWDEYRKVHPEERILKHIDPQRTDKGRSFKV